MSLSAARALNAIAAVADGTRGGGGPAITVKDNIAVAGMPMTAGTPAFAGVYPVRDATAVRLLRGAGGEIVAKTTLHELALGVTGNNVFSGPVRNPADPTRVSGGSSAGSAASLAVGYGVLSLVTDTGGSARVPAALCGVIGFRPSTGRFPMDGVVGLSPSRDTIGLMARDMEQILWADAVLSGEPDLPEILRPRIGVLDEAGRRPLTAPVAAAYDAAVAELVAAGFECLPVDLSEVLAIDGRCGFAIAMYETREALTRAAAELAGISLEALVEQVASPDVRDLLLAPPVPDSVYRAAMMEWAALRRAYAALFSARQHDALFVPTVPATAAHIGAEDMIELADGAMPVFPAYTLFTRPDSMAGLPSVSLPLAVESGVLPVGGMLVGARDADRALLALARQLTILFKSASRRGN